MNFEHRTVLVTGASRGIGAAIARAFAAEGARVIINYRTHTEEAEAVAEACRVLGGDPLVIQADVTDPSQVETMLAEIDLEFAGLDAAVNNVFGSFRFLPEARATFEALSWSDYTAQFDDALSSTLLVSRSALPLLKRSTCASIINISSDLVHKPSVPYHAYNTAKSALIGFTRNMAADLGCYGIRVNAIAPGLVYPTAASLDTKEDLKDALVAQTPLGRLTTPEDVAGAALFLASDWSRFMTGQTLTVDGGLHMH